MCHKLDMKHLMLFAFTRFPVSDFAKAQYPCYTKKPAHGFDPLLTELYSTQSKNWEYTQSIISLECFLSPRAMWELLQVIGEDHPLPRAPLLTSRSEQSALMGRKPHGVGDSRACQETGLKLQLESPPAVYGNRKVIYPFSLPHIFTFLAS